MENIVFYVLLFFIYGFIGWCLEVVCKIVELKRFVNRGFLLGPICPIYGWGVLGILFINRGIGNDVLGCFLKSMLVCSILEYLTSWFMEVFFHARWWDYSRRKFNINGRICLDTMIPFGLLGVAVIYLINPFISTIVKSLPYIVRIIICIIFVIIYFVDNLISNFVVVKIKNEIDDKAKDNTEYVREKVFDWIDDNSYIYRRIKQSYPGFDIRGRIKIVQDQFVKTVLITSDKVTVYKKMFDKNVEKIKEYNVKTREMINDSKNKKRKKWFLFFKKK